MAKLKLFQTAILFHPTDKEVKDEDTKTTIIQEPKSVLAKDEKSAAMQAYIAIPVGYHGKLDQVEVVVVNF